MNSKGAAKPVDDAFEKVEFENLEVLVKKRLSKKQISTVEIQAANVTDNRKWRKKDSNIFTDVVESVESPTVRNDETGRGEESINLENIRSVLLRNEAVSSSKTPSKLQISPPSICTGLSSSLNSFDTVVFEEKHSPAQFSTQDKR